MSRDAVKPAHALLSPSKASQWINCPPSVRLGEAVADRTSVYAQEGTLAHAIGELYLRKRHTTGIGPKKFKTELKKLTDDPLYKPEMDRHVQTYVDLIDEIANGFKARPYIALEVEVDLAKWVPESFGRCDCMIIGGNTLHVIDFKYGQGVPVSVEGNPQLRLYALGALQRYAPLYQVDLVRMTICQPRCNTIETAEMPAADLLAWGDSIRPVAQMAWNGEGELDSGEWCRFCKASGQCPRQKQDITAAQDFASIKPELLSPDEIASALTIGKKAAAAISAMEKYALAACLSGEQIPGWKAVEGGSNRKFADVDAAFALAMQHGVDEALLYERRPIALTVLEKIMGPTDFAATLGAQIIKPPGAPKLAPETDKRPPIQRATAIEDFMEENEI